MQPLLKQIGRTLFAPVFMCACVLLAAQSASAQPTRTVGIVHGKPVTAAEIGLSSQIDPAIESGARDSERRKLMVRIAEVFGRPVVERFVQKKNIQASSAEIELVQRNLHKANEHSVRKWRAEDAELKKALAAPGVSGESKTQLEQKRAMLDKLIAAASHRAAIPDDVARQMIVAWKIERELHRSYGGRVVFQQAGIEALDARRQLYEEAEKNGDIRFDDAGVRRMFFHYLGMNHMPADPKLLEQPWFLAQDRPGR
jgi:hypothetical protein